MASTDATPQPTKAVALRITFPLWLTTGLVNSGASGLDSEVSLDAGTFADCTNEATEIASSSGTYYLDLTSGEMTADTVAIQVKSSTTNAITAKITIYPNSLGKTQVDVQSIFGVQQVAPGAAGGLVIAGTNDGISFTNAVVFGGNFNITGAINVGTTISVASSMTVSGGIIATLSTVTNLTNLPSIPANWLTATGIASNAFTAAKFAANSLDAVWITEARTLTAGTNIVLPSDGLTAITGWTANITGNLIGNVTGNISGSVNNVVGDIGGNILGSVDGDVNGSVGSVLDKTGFILGASQAFNNTGTWTGNISGTVSTLTTYTGNTPQTGDSFARIGATGSGLTSLAPSATALSTVVWTNTIAGRIDVTLSTLGTSAQLVKVLAAVYDSATLSGSTLTLSNGHTMIVSATGRVTS